MDHSIYSSHMQSCKCSHTWHLTPGIAAFRIAPGLQPLTTSKLPRCRTESELGPHIQLCILVGKHEAVSLLFFTSFQECVRQLQRQPNLVGWPLFICLHLFDEHLIIIQGKCWGLGVGMLQPNTVSKGTMKILEFVRSKILDQKGQGYDKFLTGRRNGLPYWRLHFSVFKGEIGNYLFSERPISWKNVGQIGIN
jgi:hypothetical protein